MGAVSATATGAGARRRSRGMPERRLAKFMVAPSLTLIALVALYPILYAIWLSLHEYSLLQAGLSRWAAPLGLGNYRDALFGNASAEFWDAAITTGIFTVASVGLELVLGLSMAMAMHAAFKGQGLLRTVVLVPWAVLTVVTAIMWQTIFEPELGFVNSLLGAVGLPNDTVWLGSEPEALMVLIFADVWKTAPFMALLILAGLQTIPTEIYEAGKVDGATAWQRFTKITLPLLTPAILVALIFRTLDALRIFDLPFVLTKGANGTSTLSLISYQEFAQNRLYGDGAALAVLTFIIVMGVSFAYIRFVGGNIRGLAED
jgi:multiple sugar transport system permease protein